MRGFTAIDLSPQCEVRLQARYEYDLLQRIDGAAELIGELAGEIWKSPEAFDARISATTEPLEVRWCASANTAGVLIIHDTRQTLSVSLLAAGLERAADMLTLAAFQKHVVSNLHDTGYEPAFDLIELWQRPLLATVGFRMPPTGPDRAVFAMLDRCFAAAYFRRLGLA